MISSRRRPAPDVLRVLACWPTVNKSHELGPSELVCLINAHVIQSDTNMMLTVKNLAGRMCLRLFSVQGIIRTLCEQNYLERLDENDNLLNVTLKGESTLRGITTMINRAVNETKLSRWKRIQPGEYRTKFRRKSTKIKPK